LLLRDVIAGYGKRFVLSLSIFGFFFWGVRG